MLVDRPEAINMLNEFGKKREPFFFFTDFLGQRAFVSEQSVLPADVRFSIGESQAIVPFESKLSFSKQAVSYESFRESFEYVVDQIHLGNSYLVNLTAKTPISTNATLPQIFKHARAKYKLLVNDQFVLFSPETFVKIKDGFIYTHPMKGTIDAALPDAKETILNDAKEMAEHVTIVDLLRNDLSLVADQVEVTKFRYISEVTTHEKTLLQVSSEIRGKLAGDYFSKLGDIIFQLLPAGSISGAPKKETVGIIEHAEEVPRGFYTGICGSFDGKELDTGVMIRFIENQDGQLYFRSGGGITASSDCHKEYQEMIDKIYVPIY